METEAAAMPSPETPSPFIRVELDEEHKLFVKMCTTCGQEFRTGVPRSFFRNPNDDSTKLLENGGGRIAGYEQILAEDVQRRIFADTCGDDSRHTVEEKTE